MCTYPQTSSFTAQPYHTLSLSVSLSISLSLSLALSLCLSLSISVSFSASLSLSAPHLGGRLLEQVQENNPSLLKLLSAVIYGV